jgi:hypothetical protein
LYKAAYGDLKVPQGFIVPNMAPWPEPGWGLKLGKAVSAIWSNGKYTNVGNVSMQQRRQQTI